MLIQPDFLSGHGLHLDDLTPTGRKNGGVFAGEFLNDRIGFASISGPVDVATTLLHRFFELNKQFRQVLHDIRLDIVALGSQVLPVRHLCNAFRTLGADCGGGFGQVRPKLNVTHLVFGQCGERGFLHNVSRAGHSAR